MTARWGLLSFRECEHVDPSMEGRSRDRPMLTALGHFFAQRFAFNGGAVT